MSYSMFDFLKGERATGKKKIKEKEGRKNK
jgi:hypothetical protein